MTRPPPITLRLDAALELSAPAGAELLPSRLAEAAAAVLGVDGASLSLLSMDLRVPLGASDPTATVAERLQFTLGEGPCLDVLHGGTPLRSDDARLAAAWPQFHRELVSRTPFRGVIAVPLPFNDDGSGGALDLYLHEGVDVDVVDLDACTEVADGMVERLLRAVSPAALAGADDASKVPWLQADDARARMEVWVAIGVLVNHLALDAPDALAVLRAWAHSHDADLDHIAAQLVGGALDAELFRP